LAETRNGKLISFKFDEIADNLKKEDVITTTEMKQLKAWYGLRSDASHEDFSTVKKRQVELMIIGLKHFIVEHPA